MSSGPGAGIVRELTSDGLDRSLRPVAPRDHPIEWPRDDGRMTNDYWEHVLPWVGQSDLYWGDGPAPLEIGALTLRDPSRPIGEQGWVRASESRRDLCRRWSWTCSDPATVDFVAGRVGGAPVVDPLAGSGWWAALLVNRGITVTASDLYPPDLTGMNNWHQDVEPHHPVARADAVEALAGHGTDPRVLLLSWPLYDNPLGAAVLTAFRGERVIYIGEPDGGCCGDERMWEIIDARWNIVDQHRPVQWMGIHDRVMILDRRPS